MQFGDETTPVCAYVIGNIGGIVSKSAAKKQGRLNGNSGLWDDAPRMSHPTHNKIYKPTGEMPDSAAEGLYRAGLIKDGYLSTMWEAIDRESASTVRTSRLRQESNESGSIDLHLSLCASALGKLGRGKRKTMSPAAIEQRKAAGIASGKARALNSSTPF